MTFEQAKEKLQKYGQEHVFRYYDELSDAEKKDLIAQVEDTNFTVLDYLEHKDAISERGEFSPLKAMELAEIEDGRGEFYQEGVKALKEGKAAALLLAGGMGTRLGSDAPKGTYDIGLTKPVYIFERLIENL
ncbi:MAG: UDPGP type 1 family protein, partial [Lachnospiraceae bacterium]|nr:UDPGP type 1 family protein [Lachnospiraceae bacterium]